MQEKYSLTWHTYSDHLKSMMKELMVNEDFSDVTIVTEDKKHIKAHISILSMCSQVFKDLLNKEKSSNQIMYLKGIQFSEMESIMQFIYLGETTFHKERMDEIIAVAKSLEIKELYDAIYEINVTPYEEPSPTENMEGQIVKIGISELLKEPTIVSDNITRHDITEKESGVAGVNRNYKCEQCHKTYTSSGALHGHKQAAHSGVKYPCDKCDFQSTRPESLTVHIQSVHDLVKYPCGHCKYHATSKGNLSKHIQAKHDGVKYACDQCEYQATHQSSLKKHKQSLHYGVKYACSHCDHQAAQKGCLSTHIKNKHEGVKFVCDQCDYRATQKNNLLTHIKNKH